MRSKVSKTRKSCFPDIGGILLFSLVVTCLFMFPSVPAHRLSPAHGAAEPGEKKQQIEEIEKDLSHEREQFQKVDRIEESLLEDLSQLEKEVEGKRKSLKDLEAEVSGIKKELRETQAKLSRLEKSLKEVEERLGKRLDAFYRYAKRGYIRLIATADGLDTLRKRFKYLRGIMAVDLSMFQETTNLQRDYREEISSVTEKLLALNRREKEESDRMSALKEDIDKKVVLLMKTHKEREFHETGVKELELAAEKLKNTLIQIEKRDEKRNEIPSDFASARGKLPMPLEGRILRAGTWSQSGLKGITIESHPGAEVKAVYGGRIDFSGSLKGYGEVVVINHGSRYFTVSAQLAQRKKEEGDMVKAGEVIGSLGKPVPAWDAMLYFEIRKGGGSLDPLRWLKVH